MKKKTLLQLITKIHASDIGWVLALAEELPDLPRARRKFDAQPTPRTSQTRNMRMRLERTYCDILCRARRALTCGAAVRHVASTAIGTWRFTKCLENCSGTRTECATNEWTAFWRILSTPNAYTVSICTAGGRLPCVDFFLPIQKLEERLPRDKSAVVGTQPTSLVCI